MEYQKLINLLDDTTNQPSKFRTRNQVRDKSRGVYNVNENIKFETSMIRSNLCDFSDTYIHVKATIQLQTRQQLINLF